MTDHRPEQTDPNDITPLLSALLDGELDAEQRRTLSERFESDQDIEAYLDWVIVNTFCRRQMGAVGHVPPAADADEPVRVVKAGGARAWVFALAASVVLMAAGAGWLALTSQTQQVEPVRSQAGVPVALLTNLEQAVFVQTDQPMKLGTELSPGVVHLESGTAQVMFKSGALVDLTGPCTLEMVEPNRGYLRQGTVSAYVPKQAVGFILDAPDGVRVMDLGTAFRLSVDEEGRTDLTVTEGRVWLDVKPAAGAKDLSRIVAAHNTLRIAADRGAVHAGQTRPLASTGTGRQGGETDPRWQVTFASGDARFAPGAAVVMSPVPPQYLQGPEAQWIALPTTEHLAAAGATYTFMTTIDLTGTDPASAQVFGQLAADNQITAIRINGQSVSAPTMPDEFGYEQSFEFNISRGFRAGVNVVEFDVHNGPGGQQANPMALRVNWSLHALSQAQPGAQEQ